MMAVEWWRKISEELRSKALVCELGQQLAQGQRELCKQKWEMPFLFAPWIYGLGSRSCVTSAQGEGIYWAFPWWMTHRGWVPAQPPPIRLLCDKWPLSAFLPPYPFFPSFPSSPTNFIYPENCSINTLMRKTAPLHIIPDIPKVWVEPLIKDLVCPSTATAKFRTVLVTVLIGNIQNIFLLAVAANVL